MCSYCGCEAEPVIEALMADHAWIASRVRAITRALGQNDTGNVQLLAAELAEEFGRHAALEEAGLFTQLREAGEAVDEVERLTVEHRQLAEGFSASVKSGGDSLGILLAMLMRHAQAEDNDLFPYAMQMLPNECWEEISRVDRARA